MAGGRGGGSWRTRDRRESTIDQLVFEWEHGQFHEGSEVASKLDQAVSAVLSATAEYFAAKPYSISITHAGTDDVGVVIRLFEEDKPQVFAFKWRTGSRAGGSGSPAERNEERGTK